MRIVHKLAAAAVAAVLIAPAAQAQQFVRMVSGPSGGSWYPLGAKIMQVFQDNIKGISTSNQPGGGISNILAVNGGDAQIGWSYGHTTFNGYKGQGKFTKPNPNVMYFATLYPAMFQVAVRKDSQDQFLRRHEERQHQPRQGEMDRNGLCRVDPQGLRNEF